MIRKQAVNVIPSSIPALLGVGILVIGISSCRPDARVSDTSTFQETAPQPETAPQTGIVQAAHNLVHMNLDEKGIALRGYDPVSYFTKSEPVKGQDSYSLVWHDATWYFATAENRDLFSREPEKYAPANGGYCTFGIVLRKKFDGDPQVWSVIKSRLYVFLNEDVQQKFLLDSTGNLQKVAANWPTIQFKSPEEL